MIVMSSACGIQQTIANQQQILAAQRHTAAQITGLQQSVDALAAVQEQQGELLGRILKAVESGPAGVTARIVIGTPEPQ